MEVLNNNEETEPTVPDKRTLDEDFEAMTVQRVAQIAAAAHCPEDGEDDAHTDLKVFPTRQTSFRGVRRGPPSAPGVMRSSSGLGAPGVMRTSSGFGMDDPRASHRLTRNRSLRGGRLTPGRSVSNDGLRGFRRDLLHNTAIPSRDDTFDRKERGIRRTKSGDDVSVASDVDSCFTADSINLRKTQLIADPIEGMYNDLDSCADHESVYGNMSYLDDFDGYSEYAPEECRSYCNKGDFSVDEDFSFGTLDSVRVNRMQLHHGPGQGCDVSFLRSGSFSTLASGEGADIADISDDEEEIVDDDPTEKDDGEEALEATETSTDD